MSAPVSFIEWRWSKDCRLKSIAHARSVYDIFLCVYERFRVDGWKRYVNDDRLRVDGDKNMRLLAFAFTIIFVWTGPQFPTYHNIPLGRILFDRFGCRGSRPQDNESVLKSRLVVGTSCICCYRACMLTTYSIPWLFHLRKRTSLS